MVEPMEKLWWSLTQGPPNLLNKVIVATPFDRIVRKEPHTALALGEDVLVPSIIGYSRLRKNQLEGMKEGTNFFHLLVGSRASIQSVMGVR